MFSGYQSDTTDEQWAILEPLLINHETRPGRKIWRDRRDRRCIKNLLRVNYNYRFVLPQTKI